MTVEEVKETIREYVRAQFGCCRSAVVVIDLGDGKPPETLIAVSPGAVRLALSPPAAGGRSRPESPAG